MVKILASLRTGTSSVKFWLWPTGILRTGISSWSETCRSLTFFKAFPQTVVKIAVAIIHTRLFHSYKFSPELSLITTYGHSRQCNVGHILIFV